MNSYDVPENNKIKIRNLFNVTDEEVKFQVEELREWAKNVPHLPKESQDEDYLNIMLLRSKFRDDYARKNIENYFKCMSKYPQIFEKLGQFKPSEELGVVIACKKLTPNFERIAIMKSLPKNKSTKKFDINQTILVTVTTGMVIYRNDYMASVRFVLDFQDFSMLNLLKANLGDLLRLVYICETMLRIRISGFELLNAPKLVSLVLATAKLLLKPKMFSRITTHSDLDSLYKNVPKECLPSDYGGDSESTEQLVELWDHIVESQQSFFDKIATYARSK